MNKGVLQLKDFITDRLFPILCLGCEKEGAWVCKKCEEKLKFLPPVWQSGTPPLSGMTAVFSYDQSVVSGAVRALKYEYAELVIVWMGRAIDEWLDEGGAGMFPLECVIVPVPLHWRRKAKRGFNQAQLIAEELGRSLEMPVAQLLRRKHATAPQTTKSRLARLQNVDQAFSFTKPKFLFPERRRAMRAEVEGRPLILVDDVTTTGATLAACARVLQNHGFRDIYGFTFAKEL